MDYSTLSKMRCSNESEERIWKKRRSDALVLQPVTTENIQKLKSIHSAIFPVTYNAGFYRNILKAGPMARIAIYNGQTVGAVCSRLEDDKVFPGRKVAYVMTLGCLALYRRKGVGSALLEHIVFTCKADSSIGEIVLHVNTSNEDAIQFYERFGFAVISIVKNYYKRVEPPHAYLLKRILRHPADVQIPTAADLIKPRDLSITNRSTLTSETVAFIHTSTRTTAPTPTSICGRSTATKTYELPQAHTHVGSNVSVKAAPHTKMKEGPSESALTNRHQSAVRDTNASAVECTKIVTKLDDCVNDSNSPLHMTASTQTQTATLEATDIPTSTSTSIPSTLPSYNRTSTSTLLSGAEPLRRIEGTGEFQSRSSQSSICETGKHIPLYKSTQLNTTATSLDLSDTHVKCKGQTVADGSFTREGLAAIS
eukprot:CFRG4209T1